MSIFNPRKKGQQLSQRFVAMGDMRGKTRADVIAAVGRPTATTRQPYGWLVQWIAPGYHIALEVGPDDRILRIYHEGQF